MEEKRKKKGNSKLIELALYFAVMPIIILFLSLMFFPELPHNPSTFHWIVFLLIILGIFLSPLLAIISVILAFMKRWKTDGKTEEGNVKKKSPKEKIMLIIILLLAVCMAILFWFIIF